MELYIRFKVLSVVADTEHQSIIIETSHDIDHSSILPSSIRITNAGDVVEELLWKRFDVNQKKIIIYLKDTPKINERYIVRINGLKNIMDDVLETGYNQSLTFTHFIRSDFEIILPTRNSIISKLCIELKETLLEGYIDFADSYECVISSDPLHQHILYKNELFEKNNRLDIQYEGQIFIQCRAKYIQKESKKISFSDWEQTTCVLNATIASHCLEATPLFERELEVIKNPAFCKNHDALTFLLDTQYDITSDLLFSHVGATSIHTQEVFVLEHTIKTFPGEIVVVLKTPLEENMLIDVLFKNIKDNRNGFLKTYAYSFYSKINPCYCTAEQVKSLLNVESINEENIYSHIIIGSRLADYYATIKLNADKKNFLYYKQNKDADIFEKEMFVKYYAANQSLAYVRSGIAYDNSFSGMLGEIKFEPKGALPDLTSTLKNLSSEADKWKLALQGYKDHPSDVKTAIKSKKCRTHHHDRGRF